MLKINGKIETEHAEAEELESLMGEKIKIHGYI